MSITLINANGKHSSYRLVPMPPDGACLFHSLSYLLYGHTRHSFATRRSIVSHVINNWESLKTWTYDITEDNYTSEKHYQTEMTKPWTYGSACELKAAAEMYDCQFQVYRNGKIFYTFGVEGKPLKCLRFSGENLGSGHFDVYEPVASELVDQKLLSNPRVYLTQMETRIATVTDAAIVNQNMANCEIDSDSQPIRAKRVKRKGRFSDEARRKQLRAAAAKYAKEHPEVNRDAVCRYSQSNPEVNRGAVAKYTKANPGINRTSVSMYDPTHEKRLQRKKNNLTKNSGFGFEYSPANDYESCRSVKLDRMNVVCTNCKALKWNNESNGLCCNGGKTYLTPFEQLPELIDALLTGDHPDSEHFLNNARKYNSAFQMTSFGAKQVTEGGFMPTFKVQGQVYHLIGSLLPAHQEECKFLQIYFLGDEEKEAETRCTIVSGVKPSLVKHLQNVLHKHNTYISEFKSAIDSISNREKEFSVVIHADKRPADQHRGRFNRPTSGEVGVVIVGQTFEKRDIVLKSKDKKLQRIAETHRSYDALQYPLLFCYGEDGYYVSIPQVDPVTKTPRGKTVSAANFYSYRIMVRTDDVNHLLYYRSLFCQYLVDMYVKIETERLNFIRHNQKKLRADNYIHLKDAVSRVDSDVSDLGQAVILPSTFTGGPRYLHERTQDAMTYVRHYGRPDLFITFTCNPKWPDISKNLFAGQKPQDRHDIISRVFHLKVKALIDLLTKNNAFGPTICYMYTIEWQKRGLPHVHILLWLQDRIQPAVIDKLISAEIPDSDEDPILHEVIKSTMIHGPCGAHNINSPCMVKGVCSKKYPRAFVKDTQTGDDGYPQYRRRSPSDGGCTVNINGVTVDNRWVVPYNPVLSRLFNAHINVEVCNSVKSIKYVCKYINKGSDQAVFAVENQRDEVTMYETGRYISSSEAAWRIFCFPIHERFPSVVHLAVHLENGQRVYFTAENVAEKVLNPPKTTLMAFFELCVEDDFAKQLLYCEVPAFYVWSNNNFVRRKQGKSVPNCPGVKKSQVLGRVYTVHPNNSECYYLRLLLHEVRGPTSFDYLKTVAGVAHPTFKSACRALGLLEDDCHWSYTLQEAVISESANKIRQLFAIMLVFCQVTNPLALWDTFKSDMSDDISRDLERDCQSLDSDQRSNIAFNKSLIMIEELLSTMGGQSLESYGLPVPSRELMDVISNADYFRETNYNINNLTSTILKNVPMLNQEQKHVYNKVLKSSITENGTLFFLDAPGGTGKTFLINLLLATVRKEKLIAIAVASSGIAATLLDGGRTAHSAFKLPLNLNGSESPVCSITKQSNMAHVLKECKLIVWDECTMSNKAGIEALDRTLKDIRGNTKLMGGVTVVLAGDFRQTLPVVPRGTRADEVKACLKSSVLWFHVSVLSLRVNMRVHLGGNSSASEFSDLLLKIGDGALQETEGKITIPKELCELVSDLKSLTEQVYSDIKNLQTKGTAWLKERAILTSKNETANIINETLLEQFTAETKTYKSVDTVIEAEDAVNYPVEFLQTLNPPGIPQHKLTLKVGAPILLLRNLHPPKLCNGTRLKVISLHQNVVEAEIITGCGQGETVFIPRIPLIPSDLPFHFKRLQFPVKVCFAMTINKSQGQSLKKVGVDLRRDCFSHGQLYVACSRVSSADSLVILQPDGKTANVVYKEVLRQ